MVTDFELADSQKQNSDWKRPGKFSFQAAFFQKAFGGIDSGVECTFRNLYQQTINSYKFIPTIDLFGVIVYPMIIIQ